MKQAKLDRKISICHLQKPSAEAICRGHLQKHLGSMSVGALAAHGLSIMDDDRVMTVLTIMDILWSDGCLLNNTTSPFCKWRSTL